MTVYYHPIHPALQELVQCIMVIDAHTGGNASICQYPPTPQNSIFFYLADPIRVQTDNHSTFLVQPRAALVGPQTSRVCIDVQEHHKAVRIGFQPSGLYRLLGIPLGEWVDNYCEASLILGPEIIDITQQMQEADSLLSIAMVAEKYLLQKLMSLKASLPFDSAMINLIRSNGTLTMEKLASMACLSLRQLERQSHERLGYSPKFFARVTRFSNAYRMREREPSLNWTSIAHSCGYFDQMHLIRDFKEFAGVSPRAIQQELLLAPFRLQAGLRL